MFKDDHAGLFTGFKPSAVSEVKCTRAYGAQTFQNPLIKEYTLNYNGIPNMI